MRALEVTLPSASTVDFEGLMNQMRSTLSQLPSWQNIHRSGSVGENWTWPNSSLARWMILILPVLVSALNRKFDPVVPCSAPPPSSRVSSALTVNPIPLTQFLGRSQSLRRIPPFSGTTQMACSARKYTLPDLV